MFELRELAITSEIEPWDKITIKTYGNKKFVYSIMIS